MILILVQGPLRPCVFQFRNPPHLALNPIQPSRINRMREPILSNLSRNGEAMLKNIVTPGKIHAMVERTTCNPLHAKYSKENTHADRYLQ